MAGAFVPLLVKGRKKEAIDGRCDILSYVEAHLATSSMGTFMD